MIESEIIQLYKYTIRYRPGEMDEYTVILVSDNMKDMIELIADREMVDPMGAAAKWFEIGEFLWVAREDRKWYHLFDINEQDLAVKFGYDVQEQYWSVRFKSDAPESVGGFDEIMVGFEEKMGELNKKDPIGLGCGGVMGDALYGSKYVQDAIREMKRAKDMHDAQEFDAGVDVIEKMVSGEECK